MKEFYDRVHFFDAEKNEQITEVKHSELHTLPRKGELVWFKFVGNEETELYHICDVEHIINVGLTNINDHRINIYMDKGDK